MDDNASVEPTHSALIVPIPEAEPVVARHRDRLDRAASWGVPAHVTVLFPFLPPASLEPRVLDALARLTATVPAFFLTLTDIAWFGDRVVWLKPDPAAPFRQLTAAVTGRYPQCRPYEGQFADVIPHLTLGHDHPQPVLQAAAAEVRPRLPIHARVSTLRLIIGRREPGALWTTHAEFPLG